MTTAFPADPIAAVTHPDPYPYYADLVARKPIYRDETLGLWVASSSDAVGAILTSELCRVRPLAEPVPRMLLGSPAADIFGRLIRMNDGERHSPFKQAVSGALQGIEARLVAEQSRKWASVLLDGKQLEGGYPGLQDFAFHLPVYVLARLLGVPEENLPHVSAWISDYVRCLAPASSAPQIERGKVAAGHLIDLFHSLLRAEQAQSTGSLLAVLAEQAKRVGCEDQNVIVANGIGFLSQAYEATAGLIGNTVVALGFHDDVREQVTADPSLLRHVIEEVLRYDPPIQNTRRFVAQDGTVAGQAMKAGDVVLVVLAAANRDPLANPNPDRFDMFRQDRRMFSFGFGLHVCPGETPAAVIARAGVEHLMSVGVDLANIARNVTYRPSANARIALLAAEGGIQL